MRKPSDKNHEEHLVILHEYLAINAGLHGRETQGQLSTMPECVKRSEIIKEGEEYKKTHDRSPIRFKTTYTQLSNGNQAPT
jgi:hypothetical protein